MRPIIFHRVSSRPRPDWIGREIDASDRSSCDGHHGTEEVRGELVAAS
jgi:hypothetical protein